MAKQLIAGSTIEGGHCEMVGLAEIEINHQKYYRLTPSTSRFVKFISGFTHFERENSGRWCSEQGRMHLALEPGDWQVIIFLAGDQVWKAPGVWIGDQQVEGTWVTGNSKWDAGVIQLEVTTQGVDICFHGRSCFTTKATEQNPVPRLLCFWLLDEILPRPGRHNTPELASMNFARALVDLQAEVAGAAAESAFSQVGRTKQIPADSGISFRIIEQALVISRVALLARRDTGRLIAFNETTPYESLPQMQQALGRSLDCATFATAKFDKVAPLCGYASANVWHWFTEFIPRVLALEGDGFTGDYLIPSNSAIFRKTLEMLDVDSSRIREHVYQYIEVNELYISENFTGQNVFRFSSLMLDLHGRFRRLVAPERHDRKLYITRSGNRKVVNEEAVVGVMRSAGFEIVSMEDYPIEYQIKLASEASLIVGPHGAGLIAALFMKPGGSLIEFFAPTYVNPCMTPICELLGHRYWMLTSRVHMGRNYEHKLDVEVDISILRLVLRSALQRPNILLGRVDGFNQHQAARKTDNG